MRKGRFRSKLVSKGELHGLGVASGEGGADGIVLQGDAGGDAVREAEGEELVAGSPRSPERGAD